MPAETAPTATLPAIIARRPLLASLILGGIAALGFAPLAIWPLTIAALALLMRLTVAAPTARSAAWRGWWFGLGMFTVTLNWLARAFIYQDGFPPVLGHAAAPILSLYLAIYPALACAAAWLISARLRHGRHYDASFILLFAALWLIAEWLRGWVLTGFAWNPVGVAMMPTQLPNVVAPWVGTYGLGAATLMLAGIADWLLRRAIRLRPATVRQLRSGQWVVIAFVAVLLAPRLFFLFLAGPLGMQRAPQPANGVRVTVVQPNSTLAVQSNSNRDDRWNPVARMDNFRRLAMHSVRRGDPAPTPRLVLWSESAILDYLEDGLPPDYYVEAPGQIRARLAGLLDPGDMLITGAVRLEPNAARTDIIAAHNAMTVLDSRGAIVASYDKAHLVPFGEYLPFRSAMRAMGLDRFALGSIDFWPGPGPRTIDLGRLGKVGGAICYEIIFAGEVVDRAHRPDYIFAPSNDAWYGAWEPPQMVQQARLRAIEEGLPVIRATPTGISTIINPEGHIVASIPHLRAGRIDSFIPAAYGSTFFARNGNLAALGFALLLLVLAVALRWRHR